MTRFVVAGLLVAAAVASLAVPHAQAAWCQFETRYVEEAGVGFDCRFPNGLPACQGHTPGFNVPVPYVNCGGTEVPPRMGTLCAFSVGASLVDDTVHCTTGNYVSEPACEAWVDTAAPADASASC